MTTLLIISFVVVIACPNQDSSRQAIVTFPLWKREVVFGIVSPNQDSSRQAIVTSTNYRMLWVSDTLKVQIRTRADRRL